MESLAKNDKSQHTRGMSEFQEGSSQGEEQQIHPLIRQMESDPRFQALTPEKQQLAKEIMHAQIEVMKDAQVPTAGIEKPIAEMGLTEGLAALAKKGFKKNVEIQWKNIKAQAQIAMHILPYVDKIGSMVTKSSNALSKGEFINQAGLALKTEAVDVVKTVKSAPKNLLQSIRDIPKKILDKKSEFAQHVLEKAQAKSSAAMLRTDLYESALLETGNTLLAGEKALTGGGVFPAIKDVTGEALRKGKENVPKFLLHNLHRADSFFDLDPDVPAQVRKWTSLASWIIPPVGAISGAWQLVHNGIEQVKTIYSLGKDTTQLIKNRLFTKIEEQKAPEVAAAAKEFAPV
jgi:hypothetical protein